MGKFGAIAGIWIFDKINEWLGVIWLMIIVGALNIIGALLSFYFISKELWAK
jgi:hypothetical protein